MVPGLEPRILHMLEKPLFILLSYSISINIYFLLSESRESKWRFRARLLLVVICRIRPGLSVSTLAFKKHGKSHTLSTPGNDLFECCWHMLGSVAHFVMPQFKGDWTAQSFGISESEKKDEEEQLSELWWPMVRFWGGKLRNKSKVIFHLDFYLFSPILL